ncbi:MAG: hypothetical protein ACJ8AG_31300 [Ktedonobacteraceae bacterium]
MDDQKKHLTRREVLVAGAGWPGSGQWQRLLWHMEVYQYSRNRPKYPLPVIQGAAFQLKLLKACSASREQSNQAVFY